MKILRAPLEYFPGHKPSTPAFRVIPPNSDDPRDKIFQFDTNYHRDIDNKVACREERLSKYYQKISPFDLGHINKFIMKELYNTLNHFAFFNSSEYHDMFDGLATEVQEDLAVYDAKNQRTVAIHLCHANGWSAEGFIGKSFEWIHTDVKNSKDKLVVPNPNKFVDRIMKIEGTIERVGAISFNKSADLNRHPENTQGENRKFDPENPSLFMRVERQTVTPFPEYGTFLFTIKTYFYDCADPKYIDTAIDIFENTHPDLYARWFVDKHRDEVLPWLKGLK